MASEAETRIRLKAEKFLREHWPDARILHELDIGGVRLDLAAVTEDRLILCEIKSEKDTLSRLQSQVEGAAYIGGPVLVFVAEKWMGEIGNLPHRAVVLVERTDLFEGCIGTYTYSITPRHFSSDNDGFNSRALLGLLLKPELIAMTKNIGGKASYNVHRLQNMAHESMTGREVRRGVMAALRARKRGWGGDDPIV